MKDGYYIAAFISVNRLAYLYDVKLRHDQNISLWEKEGEAITLVHYWELERLTGMKNCKKPFYNGEQVLRLISVLLDSYGLSLDDIREIWGPPELVLHPPERNTEWEDIPLHSLYHLFSGLLMDSKKFYYDNIIALAVDGGPDMVSDPFIQDSCLFYGCKSVKGELEFHKISSPGPLWSCLAMQLNMQEGSLMALASASKSRLLYLPEDVDTVMEIQTYRDIDRVKKWVDALIRKVESLTDTDAGELFNYFDPLFTKEDNCKSIVVKVIQEISLKIMYQNIKSIIKSEHPEDYYLSVTGGYALNCPTNSYLQQIFSMKGFIAPPCVSDSGLSLGIGLYSFFMKSESRIRFQLSHSYYGDYDLSDESLKEFAEYIDGISLFDEELFIRDIEEAPVVWFYGRAEIGPRALGNRSILADPRNENMKAQLNKIKKRQWWRPVAPIILAEYLEDWFENALPSPFMLHTYKVKEKQSRIIPAVLHCDNTARIQSITKEENPSLHHAVTAFFRKTGVPVICNTSLNDRGEPIIDTVPEALNFALRKEITVAYINGKRILLKNHHKYPGNEPLERKFSHIFEIDENTEKLKKQYNPYDLDQYMIQLYYARPILGLDIDLTDYRKVQMIKTNILMQYGQFKAARTCGNKV